MDTFPGAFAATGDPPQFPTCQFLTLELGQPGEWGSGPPGINYLWVLDLESFPDMWESGALESKTSAAGLV